MRCYAVTESSKPLQPMEMPTPEPTGTQVLVRVTHCGVCHSDLHIWEGGYDLGEGKRLSLADRGVSLPLVMGHEILGVIEKFGPGAEAAGLKPGTPYAVYPWVGCGECAACLAEDDNFCTRPRSMGIYQNGGYGSHVLVPHPRHLVDVSGLDPAVASTFSCSGITVYSAILKVMPLPPDEPIVLVGAGGLGLAAIAVLKAMGHRRIISVDLAESKRAAARAAGASDTVDSSGDGAEVAKRIVAAAGGPVAAVIDLVNGTATARFAFDSLRKGGRMVQVGLFGGDIRVPLPLLTIRALVLQGSHLGNPKELRALVAMAKKGELESLPVRTEPIARINEVLAELAAGKVIGRVVVTH